MGSPVEGGRAYEFFQRQRASARRGVASVLLWADLRGNQMINPARDFWPIFGPSGPPGGPGSPGNGPGLKNSAGFAKQ